MFEEASDPAECSTLPCGNEESSAFPAVALRIPLRRRATIDLFGIRYRLRFGNSSRVANVGCREYDHGLVLRQVLSTYRVSALGACRHQASCL